VPPHTNGGFWWFIVLGGSLVTPSYILVYEKVVAAELVVRRFSPQNTPLPPAVKRGAPPEVRSYLIQRGSLVDTYM
jgi:hypothetical protein